MFCAELTKLNYQVVLCVLVQLPGSVSRAPYVVMTSKTSPGAMNNESIL